MYPPPPPPRRPLTALPDPVYQYPGKHLKRGAVVGYFYETHGMLYPRTFVAMMAFLVGMMCVVTWAAFS